MELVDLDGSGSAQSGPQSLSTGTRSGLSASIGTTCSSVAVTVGAADVKPTGCVPAGSTLSLPSPLHTSPCHFLFFPSRMLGSLQSTSRRAPSGPCTALGGERAWPLPFARAKRLGDTERWQARAPSCPALLLCCLWSLGPLGTVWSRAPVSFLHGQPKLRLGKRSSGSEPRLVYYVKTVCSALLVPRATIPVKNPAAQGTWSGI